jgi:hypothetical protein
VDRFSHTNNLKLAEVALAKMMPDALPAEYNGLVNLLQRYMEFLQHNIVGEWCGHYVEVCGIAAEVNKQQHIFESVANLHQCPLLFLKWGGHFGEPPSVPALDHTQ